MSWGMVAGAAIGVIGGAMNASSASSAAQTQANAATTAAQAQLQATQETNQLNANIYQQGMVNQSPYMQGGQLALSALMSGLGLGGATNSALAPSANSGNVVPGNGTVNGGAGAPTMTFGGSPLGTPVAGPNAVPTAVPTTGSSGSVGTPMAAPGTPGAVTMGSNQITPMGSAPTYTSATGSAVDANGNPINTSSTTNGIGNTNYGASQAQLNAAAGSVGAGSLTAAFTPSDLTMNPDYQFVLGQGNENLVAQEAAGGNRFGAQTLKDMTAYNQNYASQQYQNAFNNYQTNQSNVYNRLSALAGTGQTAVQNANASGTAAGQTIGSTTMAGTAASNNLLTSAAAASAAGQVGSTGALVGGINSGINSGITMNYLNGIQNNANGSTAMLNGGGFTNTPAYLTEGITGPG